MKVLPPVLSLPLLAEAYRNGALTPPAMVDSLLERIRATPHQSSIWISLVPDDQLHARTEALSALWRAYGVAVFDAYPLFGMPYSVKDNIDVAGLPTTAACPQFAFTPPASAAVVEKLEAAGAILIGKTNLDQFATGLTGTRSPYGAVKNPFDARYISGGSSSGSAVSVALGQAAFSLGTDTAGSGRVPAGFCNVVGFKPTPGLASTRGVVPACRSLDCVSVFAPTVADGWRVLQTLAGHDSRDAYSRRIRPLASRVRRARIGVPDILAFYGDACAEEAFAMARRGIAELPRVDMSLVDFSVFAETAALLYEGPWLADRRASFGDFVATYPEAIDPSVRKVLAGSETIAAADVFRGYHKLHALRQRAAEIFETIDILLVPTAPKHPTLAEVHEAPIERNSELGRYTNFVNLLGLSALALPGPFRGDGLPSGITLIAPGGGDHRLANFARTVEPIFHRRLGISMETPEYCPGFLSPLPDDEPKVKLAVVGAHLLGEPLNWQLIERGGRLLRRTRTAPRYRLYALPNTQPPKPGLTRCATGGHAITVEVWELPLHRYGDFVADIPSPLGIATIELEDGECTHGFICEAWAAESGQDISSFGGWQAYLATTGATHTQLPDSR